MKTRIFALLCVLVAVPAAGQVAPAGLGGGVTPPIFGLPASAVDGGGGFSGQLLAPVTPTDCSAPGYSFTGDTNTGVGYYAADTFSMCAGGFEIARFIRTGGVSQALFGNLGISGNSLYTGSGAITFNAENSGNVELTIGAAGADVVLAPNSNVTEQRAGTTAQRFDVANTWTSASNNELFSVDWRTTSNVAFVGTRTAATGTGRAMRLVSQQSSAADVYAGIEILGNNSPFASAGLVNAAGTWNQNTTVTGNLMQVGRVTSTVTAGTVVPFAITPTYNQASGNAANTDLLVQRTETAVGSGTQYLIQAGTAASPTKFAVTTAGLVTAGSLTLSGIADLSSITFNGAARQEITSPADGLLNIKDQTHAFGIQLNTGANAAPTVTSCGTGSVTSGSRNVAGEITATGATACTVTFATPAWTNTPFCVATDGTGARALWISGASTTAFTVNGLTAGDKFTYHCIGRI